MAQFESPEQRINLIAPILIGLVALGCIGGILAGVLPVGQIVLGILPTTRPTQLPTPIIEIDLTSTPVIEVDPTATPTATSTPIPTPTELPTAMPAGSLSISNAKAQRLFEQAGFRFITGDSYENQPMMVGITSDNFANIYLIGPNQDITTVITQVMLPGDTPVEKSAPLLKLTLASILPNWAEGPAWIEQQLQMMRAISGTGGNITVHVPEQRVTLEMILTEDGRVISLMILGSGSPPAQPSNPHPTPTRRP